MSHEPQIPSAGTGAAVSAPSPAPLAEPTAPPTRRPARPPLVTTALACAGILALAVVAGLVLARTRPVPPRQDAPPEARLGVRVVEARRRAIEPQVEGLGRARASRRVTVSAQIGGLITALHPALEAGLRLPADAEAVRIDPADARASLAEAEARLAGARAERDRLSTLRASLDERIRVARELVALERAETERMRTLVGAGILREREPDAARLALLSREDALLGLESQRAQLDPQLAAAEAALAETQARLDMARLNESRTRVPSPLAGGLVASRQVEVGQLVSPGQALFEVWDVDHVEVPVALTVAQALLVAPDLRADAAAPVNVEVHAELGAGERTWPARLARLEPVDPATQTVRAVVVVENAAPEAGAPPPLLPGVFCRVVLRGTPAPAALVIPLEALQERGRVFLAEDQALVVREVALGHRLGGWVEVRDGVREGELVITSPVERPIAGLPLQVVREPAGEEEAK